MSPGKQAERDAFQESMDIILNSSMRNVFSRYVNKRKKSGIECKHLPRCLRGCLKSSTKTHNVTAFPKEILFLQLSYLPAGRRTKCKTSKKRISFGKTAFLDTFSQKTRA